MNPSKRLRINSHDQKMSRQMSQGLATERSNRKRRAQGVGSFVVRFTRGDEIGSIFFWEKYISSINYLRFDRDYEFVFLIYAAL